MKSFSFVLTVVAILLSVVRADTEIPDSVVQLDMSTVSRCGQETCFLILYAPWCGHCRALFGRVPDFAEDLKNAGVLLAAANADALPGLQMRFSLDGFPCVFFTHEGKTYRFPRSIQLSSENIVDFVKEGYKKEEPISGLRDPFGPAMKAFGIYTSTVIALIDMCEPLAKGLNVDKQVFFMGACVATLLMFIVVSFLMSKCIVSNAPATEPKKDKKDKKSKEGKKEDATEKPTAKPPKSPKKSSKKKVD